MSARTDLDRREVKRLIDLMKDPRYWHADDPAILRDVRAGFKQLWTDATPADPRDVSRRGKPEA